ncbi:MAG: DNA translocase FtsK, partial [Pseudomonadota bacterium]
QNIPALQGASWPAGPGGWLGQAFSKRIFIGFEAAGIIAPQWALLAALSVVGGIFALFASGFDRYDAARVWHGVSRFSLGVAGILIAIFSFLFRSPAVGGRRPSGAALERAEDEIEDSDAYDDHEFDEPYQDMVHKADEADEADPPPWEDDAETSEDLADATAGATPRIHPLRAELAETETQAKPVKPKARKGLFARKKSSSTPASSRSGERREPRLAGIPEPAPRVKSVRPQKKSKRQEKERQRKLNLGDDFILPAVDILAEPEEKVFDISLASDALEQNARLLETVLNDFSVKGEIVNVRPGPVVTLYELLPGTGVKNNRVIVLADDIARSMSAVSARVALIPGTKLIGIELPNSRRETVYLRELIASSKFDGSKGALPIVLGKTIGGEPVIEDLAPMPHLLVAGTTGAGKSVGLNAMILSLLYRLTPDDVRFIMIDPKMLELSIYDGIPHLLSPVVTDPRKAVVALKWAVREMEDRYRMLSDLSVRNISAFNDKVRAAQAKGKSLSRPVHTGYDDDGEPIYETKEFSFEPLPRIVIIVDEMADLMVVAGKEIEITVQRLAQMARAAGIHLIMATQRPSVDVITGIIKANLPTRISFQVTSKIDSRTILGVQGAEQLLGRGDMLFMPNGKKVVRVHGPFVSDEEVEDVVAHLKTQGRPEYIVEVTEGGDDDDDGGLLATGGGKPSGDELYDRAVALVAREGKASTSFVQRHLEIGYNRAAKLVERMEKEGVISAANHVGKREVLISDHGGGEG